MKNILKTVGALLFVTSFSMAAANTINQKTNVKNVFIPADSVQGQTILKTEQEYRRYLDKKISKAEFEKDLFIATKQNCKDIYLLKKAVVKIINELNKLKQENKLQNKLIKELKKKLNKIKKKKLTDNVLNTKKTLDDYLKNKETEKKIKKATNDIAKVGVTKVTAESIIKTTKSKIRNICIKKEIIVGFDKEKIKQSYIKFFEPKQFTVIGKYVYLYDYPLLKFSKKIGKFKYGEKVIGDMYTKAGWVHINDKDKNVSGWVKGYLIYPKVLYSLKKPSIKNSAFIKKDIIECIQKERKDK